MMVSVEALTKNNFLFARIINMTTLEFVTIVSSPTFKLYLMRFVWLLLFLKLAKMFAMLVKSLFRYLFKIAMLV